MAEVMQRIHIVTNDARKIRSTFNLPKSNVFLWPTDPQDFDFASIIFSSILSLPIVLKISYPFVIRRKFVFDRFDLSPRIYAQLIDGMALVDRHCRAKSVAENICVQLALIRIWLTICQRNVVMIVTADESLRSFGTKHITQVRFSHRRNFRRVRLDVGRGTELGHHLPIEIRCYGEFERRTILVVRLDRLSVRRGCL